MTLHRLGERPPRRVGILRALQLGDLLCAVPALRALRAALPDAEMVLIGLPWARSFVERFDMYLNSFREFPGYPGLPEQAPRLERIGAFLDEIQAEEFDLVLQMQGSGRITNPLAVLLGARITAGFWEPGGYCPDPERFLLYPDHGLEIERLLSLVEFLGVPARGTHLEFPLRPEDHRALLDIPESRRLQPGQYVCVHVGASTPARRWPLWNFVEVAGWLADRGLAIALSGTAAEAGLTASIAAQLPNGAVNLAGRTDLGCLAALLSGAALLICNDTGVSHLADALRVPSVVISTGKNPQRWAPRDQERYQVLCRETGVLPSEVIHQAKLALNRYAGRAGQASAQVSSPAPAALGLSSRNRIGETDKS